MNDDSLPAELHENWRLRVELDEEGRANRLTEQLEARELTHDLENAYHDRVIVYRDGSVVFCFAGTRSQAEGAGRLISSLAAEHGWHLHSELAHWHPFAEDWEDPDRPLPDTDAERIAEHAALVEHEREETAKLGYPEWEVRVQCSTPHKASQLSEKLRGEGLPHVHRWRYLLIGAADEDSAGELAERIEREAPAQTRTSVEVTARAALAASSRHPFAVFGGTGV
jgi:hypothetical protein